MLNAQIVRVLIHLWQDNKILRIIAKVVNPVQVVIHPHMPHVLFVLQEPCVLLLANE
ncbi:uncharacterized protein PGTG_20655 [Puccinia graminis f. sp. tritici CRL 75-36-700-3]|uniref:Uncharacterized protein n=1 Tax=Puccinia graminis f. sp. tritici (strain CRL 75-36-700-3 / race SCCL) TaxID=418459 RepID=H6QPC2_PUCGT|nr:uncharacterized protein PGTG_20655 [Puccinia graminis f. sp. tritici CRL 75-36-700-3]EHS63557.1 hypothetical protein PGTG_20655 [Puccinia graminis f. sp. tritici CRL 75-36-700-3]